LEKVINAGHAKVNGEYVNSLQALGYQDLTLEEVIDARHARITANYIKSLEALGYKDIPF